MGGGAGTLSKAHCLTDMVTNTYARRKGFGWRKEACLLRILASGIFSNLLERILKECLPGNADLHMAGQGI